MTMESRKGRPRTQVAVDAAVNPVWAQEGVCDYKEGERDWFSDDKREWRECQKICNSGCPVKNECLNYALETRQTYGVWGGCDQRRLREALGVDSQGLVHDYAWKLHCPKCAGLNVTREETGPGVEACVCTECHQKWTRLVVETKRRKKSA